MERSGGQSGVQFGQGVGGDVRPVGDVPAGAGEPGEAGLLYVGFGDEFQSGSQAGSSEYT